MAEVFTAVTAVCDFLEQEICPNFLLKRGQAGKDFDDGDPEWVHPTVYPLWLPPSTDWLTQTKRAVHPSIAVMATCETSLARAESRVAVTLGIGTWNPGTHACETTDPDAPALSLDMEGWAEGFRIADAIVDRLRRQSSIGAGLVADISVPAKLGPWEEDGALVDFYPFYYTRLTFEATMATPPSRYQSDFL